MDQDSLLASSSNQLLKLLSSKDAALLHPHLSAVVLKRRDPLEDPNTVIEHIYFPETGVVSVVAIDAKGRQIEAGIFGREGMSGSAVILGNHRSPNATYMQVAGAGRRMSADTLRDAMDRSATLRAVLLRYFQCFLIQTTQTALTNGRDTLEVRLARWLVMCHDRIDGEELSLTHEFVSLMLGVRRAGVTVATHALEGERLIRAKRGVITILDREGLIEKAGGSYGIPEAEYKRLMEQPRQE